MKRAVGVIIAVAIASTALIGEVRAQNGRGGRVGAGTGPGRGPAPTPSRTPGATVDRPTPGLPVGRPGSKAWQRRFGERGTDGGTDAPDADDHRMPVEDRLKYGRKFLKDLEKSGARIKDVSLDYDVMLMSTKGKVRKLDIRYRRLNPGRTVSRHRVTVFGTVMGRKRMLEDFILHEMRGTRVKAWRQVPGARFALMKKPALAHKLGDSELTLEALLPIDHTRYKMEYEGVAYRDGRRTDVFKAVPKIAGTSNMEVAWRIKERIPCRWKSFSPGKPPKQTWGGVASNLRIRDGMFVLDRRSLEFSSGSVFATIKVRSRAVNKGLEPDLFAVKKESL